MKYTKFITLAILFLLWLIITTGLCLSILGWVLIFPVSNDSYHFKGLGERRSTWMSIGLELKDYLVDFPLV